MENERLSVLGNKQFQEKQKVKEISIKGAATFHKEVLVKTFHILGYCKIKAPVEADEFVNKGSCSVDGALTCHHLKNVGQGSFATITGNYIDSSGSLHISKSLLCTIFQSKGFLQVKDVLVGERVFIEVSSPSNVKEIEGKEEVIISSSQATFLNILSLARRKMVANTIKGKYVTIEQTEVDCVYGDDVKIGQNCKVGEVIYSNKVYVHKSSTVDKMRKLER
ncbi:hypothetical protein [Bacillus sp. JCM 19034]|uniref:hypothetical protein n=1 Tax=Bacillus sp. JCM 19034 TaxID=1481928 RepID=UPI0007846345|nr:hypothetical protein [Bacillus sp. JCM 19034]